MSRNVSHQRPSGGIPVQQFNSVSEGERKWQQKQLQPQNDG